MRKDKSKDSVNIKNVVETKEGLKELQSDFVMKLKNLALDDDNGDGDDDSDDKLEAIKIVTYMISVIDRCKLIAPRSEQFWQTTTSNNNGKSSVES